MKRPTPDAAVLKALARIERELAEIRRALSELQSARGPDVVDWKGLKAMGWPYSRAHTWRLMAAGKFPQAYKLGTHLNAHPVWRAAEVRAHLARR